MLCEVVEGFPVRDYNYFSLVKFRHYGSSQEMVKVKKYKFFYEVEYFSKYLVKTVISACEVARFCAVFDLRSGWPFTLCVNLINQQILRVWYGKVINRTKYSLEIDL